MCLKGVKEPLPPSRVKLQRKYTLSLGNYLPRTLAAGDPFNLIDPVSPPSSTECILQFTFRNEWHLVKKRPKVRSCTVTHNSKNQGWVTVSELLLLENQRRLECRDRESVFDFPYYT